MNKLKIKTTSAIIGKLKKSNSYDGMDRPVFISLFNVNDPHKTDKAPKKRYDFKEGVHKIILTNLEVDYLLAGHDILINNLSEIEFKQNKEGHLHITGKQKL
ncbi:MAG: hypothetical protein CMH63_02975 [Nanoarchaeota archaeon]|nr:hypothetical protein [Nanoarchaeota archaeon]